MEKETAFLKLEFCVCGSYYRAETKDLIKRLTEWKENVENRGMRVNMYKTK